MTNPVPPCDDPGRGHIWVEEDGTLFNRRREKSSHTPIPVHCMHCGVATTLVGWGKKR